MRLRLLTLILVTLAAAGLLFLNARSQHFNLVTDYDLSGDDYEPIRAPAEIHGWPLTTAFIHSENVLEIGTGNQRDLRTFTLQRLEPRPPHVLFTLNALVCVFLLAAFALVTESLLNTFLYREKPKTES